MSGDRRYRFVAALLVAGLVLSGCVDLSVMSEEMTSGGTIQGRADGVHVVWLTECLGGTLEHLRVWTASEVLWEVEAEGSRGAAMEPGTHGVTYGVVPSGFVEVVAPRPLTVDEFIMINWSYREAQRRELPPGFGATVPFDPPDGSGVAELAEEVCGEAGEDGFVLKPLD